MRANTTLVKHHDERIKHLRKLAADLDRQIADAQQLQRSRKAAAAPANPERNATEPECGAPGSSDRPGRRRR